MPAGSSKVSEFLRNGEFPYLHSDQGLDVALHRMGSSRSAELPVVSRRDIHKLEGVINLNDVLRVYGLDER
jgi:hypothetical protein